MAILCKNEDRGFWWQQWMWPKVLRLAKSHGWKPLGTQAPADWEPQAKFNPWKSDNYTSNDGQIVVAEDAASLADALSEAISHLRNDDALAAHRLADGGIRLAPNPPEATDADWLSGSDSKAYLAEFVQFCRQGSFTVN